MVLLGELNLRFHGMAMPMPTVQSFLFSCLPPRQYLGCISLIRNLFCTLRKPENEIKWILCNVASCTCLKFQKIQKYSHSQLHSELCVCNILVTHIDLFGFFSNHLGVFLIWIGFRGALCLRSNGISRRVSVTPSIESLVYRCIDENNFRVKVLGDVSICPTIALIVPQYSDDTAKQKKLNEKTYIKIGVWEGDLKWTRKFWGG